MAHTPSPSDSLPGPLVSGHWLATNLARPGMRVIDFRWELQAGSRRDQYLAGHIPGAVFVSLEDVTGSGGPGRHPLPTPDVFARAMRAAGLRASSTVVVYDATGGGSAARLWWLLRHFGHQQVAVLDGGIGAWEGPLERGEVTVDGGDFQALPAMGDIVDRGQVAGRAPGAVLIDARAAERYRGDMEPIDPRAGHVPGAVNVPWSDNLGTDQRFLDAAALRRQYQALGVQPGADTIVYCGSGVTACVGLLGLAVAGLDGGLLYEGSWSDWSAQPGLPLASGDQPGDQQDQ